MFDRKTFLGASIKGVNSSIGWNGSPSQLNISLVEDLDNGDSFTPTSIGQPVYCEIGSYTFYGILEKYTLDKSSQSGINYNVFCVDPSKLLENTKLILRSYNGSTYGLKNLLNVYGYLENVFGFGGSQINPSGIPWMLVRDAMLGMVNSPSYGTYGGPITYKGYSYSLDLSDLPGDLPSYFRVSGDMSILDFIRIVCEYSNYDFFVQLQGLKIKVRTVSKYTQPALGTLSTLIANYSGTDLIRSSAGIEARNETTSAFLTGGEVTDLYRSDEIVPFYGLDINNQPIYGVPGWVEFRNSDGDITFREETYYFGLDCSVVSDILGMVTYPTSEFELRIIAAGGENAYSSWISFIQKFRPDIAARLNFPYILNLTRPATPVLGGLDIFGIDVMELALVNIANARNAAISETAVTNLRRFYQYLEKIAQAHLGKTFLVKLPFILSNTESESGRLLTSYEVTDQGYLDTTTNTLDGLLTGSDAIKATLLSSNDGRYPAIACYFNSSGLDLTKTSANDSLLASNDDFYIKVAVNPKIYFYPEPAVIVTLPQAGLRDSVDNNGMLGTIYNGSTLTIYEELAWNAGVSVLDVARADGVNLSDAIDAANITFRLSPRPVKPSSIHIPLKSNILTYGPWYAAGVDGNIRYEQDTSLVPWNYGGLTFMNLAANAKVSTSISNVTEIETGFIEVAGLPQYDLGDVLEAGGPNVTDISIQYNTGGVTTTYRFSTYVPRFGQIGKYYSDRIRSTGLLAQSYSRNARETALEYGIKSARVAEAAATNRAFLASLPRGIRRETPHNVIFSKTKVGTDDIVRYGVSTVELGEAIFFIDPTGASYKNTVLSTVNHNIVPVSIYGSGTGMSQMELPSGIWDSRDAQNYSQTITAQSYNPYTNQETPFSTDIFTFGNTYPSSGINTFLNNPSTEVRRVFATKGPILLSSWGIDLEGNAVPGTGGRAYPDNFLVKSHKWKTGPVDLLWDDKRKVWTSHDIVKGTYNGYDGLNVVNQSGVTGWTLPVRFYGFTPTSGQKVFAGYVFTDNKWYVLPQGSGSSGTSIPTGEPYTVFYTNSTGVQEWSTSPYISTIKVGGSEVNVNGHIELGRTDNKSTKLFSGPLTSSGNLRFYFPDNVPATGYVLRVKTFDNSETLDIFTEWAQSVSSGDTYIFNSGTTFINSGTVIINSGNTITNYYDYSTGVPTGPNYTVFHTTGSGTQEWSASPTISSLNVGGSGIGDGFVSFGRTSYSPTRLFGGALASGISRASVFLPYNMPATGQYLRIESFTTQGTGLDIITYWDSVTTSATGLTKTFDYVSNVSCSGSSLVVTKRTLVFVEGLLQSES